MEDVLPQVPSGIIALGNLDPAGLLKDGDTAAIRMKTEALLGALSSHRNFVLSSGCDIPPGTPLENIGEIFAVLAEYNERVHAAAAGQQNK
jgi:uroporphyrinogen decarboxylase